MSQKSEMEAWMNRSMEELPERKVDEYQRAYILTFDSVVYIVIAKDMSSAIATWRDDWKETDPEGYYEDADVDSVELIRAEKIIIQVVK